MNNIDMKSFHAERWVYIFIFVHLICWTLVPSLVRYNLPLDAIEGTIWGHQLQWGYDKNPYLNGWLTALAVHLGGQSGWMVYLFSQLSVAACFWAVWKLAKNILSPAYALIAVMVLEGVQYYNLHAIDFNDNTLELSTWALATYFFYQACRSNRFSAWILTGACAGLGMMAKYYTAALLAAMVLFMLVNADNRKKLATLAPYAGLLTFLIIILPHAIWLFFHEFITVAYVFARGSSHPSWTNHLYFAAQFTFQQFLTFLPAMALFGILFIGKKPTFTPEKTKLSAFNKLFLYCLGLGPFLLTLLLSILCGTNLRAGWGAPLLSLLGIILLTELQPNLTQIKMRTFIITVFSMMGLVLSGYSYSLISATTPSSANFPGKEIAQIITEQWHNTYHTKLEYVAGSRWVGGNIGFYSADHPAVFIEWDKSRAPWIDIKKMQKKGAVFVWAITDREYMPYKINEQFPQLQKETVMEIPLKRNTHHLPPIKIGLAILPPSAWGRS